jgi:hypothetical protein
MEGGIGGTCSKNEGNKKNIQNMKGRGRFQSMSRQNYNNNKIYLRKILCESVDWIHLAEDRVQRRDCVNETSGSISSVVS